MNYLEILAKENTKKESKSQNKDKAKSDYKVNKDDDEDEDKQLNIDDDITYYSFKKNHQQKMRKMMEEKKQ